MYRFWAKVGKDKTVTYHGQDLITWTAFLDKAYPNWTYFNVYDKKTGVQLASFTKNNRPTFRKVQY